MSAARRIASLITAVPISTAFKGAMAQSNLPQGVRAAPTIAVCLRILPSPLRPPVSVHRKCHPPP